MSKPTVDTIESTYQQTMVWLNRLAETGHFDDPRQAYSALRAVLHTLRDRLTVNETAHLAAQLPMLVRGLYFDGWNPSRVPTEVDTSDEFFVAVRNALNNDTRVSAEHATEEVFRLLEDELTAGLVDHVKKMLPESIRDYWNEAVSRREAASRS